MQRVFVIGKNKKPLMPCHPARARELLGKGKAKVFRLFPFTIILTEREDGDTQPISFRTDPGRGSRQMCRMDRYGFPRTAAKKLKIARGFQTGDIVRAIIPKGKKAGTHIGKVAIRTSGSFRVGKTDGISWKYCRLLQRSDGYEYGKGDGVSSPA